MNSQLVYIPEPEITFDFSQSLPDPRDGLSLFGPLAPRIHGIRSGVVATKQGLAFFKKYLQTICKPVYNHNNISRPFFPGFESVFGCQWNTNDILFKEISTDAVQKCLGVNNNFVRTYDVVSLFINPIIESKRNDDTNVDVWFVIVPDEVYKYCRPKSVAPHQESLRKSLLSTSQAKSFQPSSWLFSDMQNDDDARADEARKFSYDAQFHDQLKARLLPFSVPTQVFRESTLAWQHFKKSDGAPLRDFSKIEGHLAWTTSTAAYYKAGGKPWKLSNIRTGVCYLGLVYKRVDSRTSENACCAAQMFLDSGDGTIFRGEVGPWYNPESKEFHLNPREARALIKQAVDSYKNIMKEFPNELFIHARTKFNNDEWFAFREAVPLSTKIVGICITPREQLKLFRRASEFPIMRGMAYIVAENLAYLWTNGYIPRLQTASSLEVPTPLQISIDKGKADINIVLKDILALTKLNYNACIYGDGLPVTLRFADKIGNILTASQEKTTPPLAFKYYI